MKLKISLLTLMMSIIVSANAIAAGRPVIYVNQDVTTHIVMPEMLKMVDISTPVIAGDQCADNMVRIKPISPDSIPADVCYFGEYRCIGTVTLLGERHMAQYDIIYEPNPREATSLYRVTYDESVPYSNPEVAMPESEMAAYAWAISNSKRKFNSIRSKAFGIQASIFNIYAIGEYFFIDMYLRNKTNIPYDIAQMKVFLTDKHETKATNSQTLELTPAYVLNSQKHFNKDYHQVLVLDKLTFPNEKVLNIEISEDQISGRVITIPIEYEDILNADCFDSTKADAYKHVAALNRELLADMNTLRKDLSKKDTELAKAESELKAYKARDRKRDKKLQAMQKLDRELRHINLEYSKELVEE